MKERNRDSLKRALGRLPQFDPPRQCWAGIEAGLGTGPAGEGQQPPLRRLLPEYSPPPSVWNRINQQLSRPRPTQPSTLRLPRLPVALWRAAAAIALLIGSFAIVQALNRGPEVSYSYRKETNFEPTFVADWRQEEPQFREMIALTADSENPKVNRLRAELEELTDARADIETMLEEYGEDTHLVRRLGEIERERSEVYRRLIVFR